MKLAWFRPLVATALIVATFATSNASADSLGYRSVPPLTPTLQLRPVSPSIGTWGRGMEALPAMQAGPSLNQAQLFPQGMSTAPFLSAPESSAPSSGLGFIIAGWILTGASAVTLASLPLCFTSVYDDYGVKEICLGVSAGFVVVGLGVGIPLLIVGYNQRKKYKAWEKDHPALSQLGRTQLAPVPGGAAALYTASF